MSSAISIRGAREHNLKNISLDIPRDQLVVITGVSGSGKSSLAFDTLYAEGQRRYVESLSAYARQFLDQMSKPDVESIEGLSPAISIEQKSTSRNPRSTVGTVTEIHDYLRLLYARIGNVFCYSCGRPMRSQTPQQIVDRVMEMPEGTVFSVFAPIVRARKGEYAKDLQKLQRQGFARVRIDGVIHELERLPVIDKQKKHNIDLHVDRMKVQPARMERRLSDSVETALRFADGIVIIEPDGQEPQIYSEHMACAWCNISYPEIEPRLFSFNSPQGACPECSGLGHKMFFDPDRIVADPSLSVAEGAIQPWSNIQGYYGQMLESLASHFKFDLETPFRKLPERIRKVLLHGSGTKSVKFKLKTRESRSYEFTEAFMGVVPWLDRRYKETESESVREELEQYMSFQNCPSCDGARLRIEARSVMVAGTALPGLSKKTVADLRPFFAAMKLTEREEKIASRILKEIRDRLDFLDAVGLDYLSMDRAAGTLSGGEGQRIRLATQIGSSLVGVMYVLDEPSIGLHQRDNARLLSTLKRLRDLGNSVIVVEHDEETIREADYVVDMGLGAGEHGGEIVVAGPPKVVLAERKSLTGAYLRGELGIPVPAERRTPRGWIQIQGARGNNLKTVNARFPVGTFTAVTGVSGSGKSTLVIDTLYPAATDLILRDEKPRGAFGSIKGLDQFDKVIDIDQSPIGRTPRSNPATYTGVFTLIRDMFTQLPEAKLRGYKPGRFSFNVKGGRCETCGGEGFVKIEMHFLPDIYVRCDACAGRRYNRDTLEVKYKGQSIADVLDMPVERALEFLSAYPRIIQILQTLMDVGLGYIRLGQAATTLSGGEAQRVKLSRELARRSTGKTLYILDEPTTGLHFADVHKLLDVLHRLVNEGNTVVVIEHNLDVIKTADWVIDLGPEGGDRGGDIIAAGMPEMVAAVEASHTGKFIRAALKGARTGTLGLPTDLRRQVSLGMGE
ncbi:MAG: excinuclease ABC subunit UvrA [Deltaproteobacteria bacterium]|nr:excinuclease ABC subunit UvrA [Deltaproteobacteria bacterium]